MNQQHYDLAIIGAGTGGYVAAIRAAQLGMSVAIIEQRDVGGTCLNRGCIPTKTLLHSADLYSELAEAAKIGVVVEGAQIDYEALRARVAEVCGTLRGGVEKLLEANGVDRIVGTATVDAPGTLSVTCADGSSRAIFAASIIIATGSVPARIPVPGADAPGVLTSDEMLERVPEFKRLVIVGGGVIGVEFAGIYAALGTEVTVIEALPRLIATLDRELGQSLAMSLRKQGCTVICGARVSAIEEQPDGSYAVRYSAKDAEEFALGDAVLIATGRTASSDNLFAEGCTPALNGLRIVVDGQMHTNIPGLYAIGDVADAGPQLAHAASAQAIIAVETIAHEARCAAACGEAVGSAAAPIEAPAPFDPRLVPSCIYTSPEIASVGLSEAEAKEAGIQARSSKFAMSANGKTIITDQDRSFIKIVTDAEDRIIGAQLLCGHATDIVGEFAVAVALGLTIEQMEAAIRPHPTFEEAVGEALESFGDGAIHALPRKRV